MYKFSAEEDKLFYIIKFHLPNSVIRQHADISRPRFILVYDMSVVYVKV